MQPQSQIAVIGLAVMGKNLALNLASRGFRVSVYNRTVAVTHQLMAEQNNPNLIPAESLESLVELLQRPRKIILMIKAGRAVDAVIEGLAPLLEEGDILLDGGNSYFKDTERRSRELAARGLHYCGLGVSGGEKGARFGPALMPGCTREVYAEVAPYLEAIAAKAPDGKPCCAHMGTGGAGHYVKMVHNGIEYADMALITELYDLLRHLGGLTTDEISGVFSQWNEGPLASYLLEITADLLRVKEAKTQQALLDSILDIAEQKGTGLWTNREAIEQGVEVSILAAGLNVRVMSMLKPQREAAQRLYQGLAAEREAAQAHGRQAGQWRENLLEWGPKALYAARLLAYAQGFALYRAADEAYQWSLNYGEIAATFRAGCIIRSALLEPMREAFARQADLPNLLLDPVLAQGLAENLPALRQVVALAVTQGLAVPALAAAVAYFDTYTREESAANLIQAQRDYFGAHTYRRRDQEGTFHNEWEAVSVDAEGHKWAQEVRQDG